MSAGYIQLAAIGQQDAYLTGEPQVTYFSGVYKRHTPFVLEAYDIPFNDQIVTYGGTSICRIPPKGDLIRGLTLKVTLPALYNPGGDWTWPQNPSPSNYPILWVTLSNNTVLGPIQTSYQYPYYSTVNFPTSGQAPIWGTNFTANNFVSYVSSTNKFSFNNVASVIVQSSPVATSASSGVFWGLDPINYSSIDAYGNLVYTATVSPLSNLSANSISNSFANVFISTLTPSFSLEQSGWVRTQGLPIDPLPGLSLSLNQVLPLTGQQFLNFSATSGSGSYWTPNNLLTTRYTVTAGGCIQFLRAGYYAIRAGFSLGTGSIQSVSYGVASVDGQPVTPSFVYTYNYTVSPDPSSPTVIPINVSALGQYYYFYATTTGVQALPGTYFSISPVNDFYQVSTPATLNGTSSARIPFYSNIATPSGYLVTLEPDSTFKFSQLGTYLLSGSLSLSNTTPERYITSLSLSNVLSGSNVVYTYDMSQQGRNPTYAFSIPLVATSNATPYSLNVSTNGPATAAISVDSFVAIQQIGDFPGIETTYSLPLNGVLLSSSSTTLTTPLNLNSNFGLTSNSTFISVNSAGNLVFQNSMTYMLTAVLNTSKTVTGLTVNSADSSFSQSFDLNLGISPPYTISVPLNITNNLTSYSVSLTTSGTPVTVLSSTYLAVYPLSSSQFQNPLLTNYSYYDSVGTFLIQNADLKIGGQTIQSITGEYIEVWNELNVSYENQPGLQLLTGKYDTGTSIAPPGRTYYVNLPYYFYGNPELSIPITALGRQDVEVWVTFRRFSELTSFASTITNPTLSATIITEYVYLANPEIDWFQNHRIDYIITQAQYQEFDLPEGFQTAIFPLDFKGPVKELFFVTQPLENLVLASQFPPYNYVVKGSTSPDLQSLGMTFNGEDAFLTSATNALYVGAIEPFNHHVNFFSQPPPTSPQPQIPGRQFFMYAFSTNPNTGDPSGSINFSRIRNVLLELNVSNPSAYYPAKQFRVTATSQNILRVENGIAGLMFD